MTEDALEVCETTARAAFSILHLGVADTTKDNVPHAGRVSDVQPHSSTSPDANSTRKPTLNRSNEHAYRTAPPCLAAGNTAPVPQRVDAGRPEASLPVPSRTSAMPLTERR